MIKIAKSLTRLLLVASGVAALSTTAGLAQQNQSGAAPAQSQAGPAGWFKICDVDKQSKKQICAMNFELSGQNGRTVASVRLVEIEGVERKALTILVPPGLLLQPGMRAQIDSSKPNKINYQICFPNACVAETRVPAAYITSLKRGNELKLTALNQQGKEVEFKVTLAGFTASYDGPGLDPEVAQAQRETLQQKLQRRAEEARKKLLEQQGGAAATQSN